MKVKLIPVFIMAVIVSYNLNAQKKDDKKTKPKPTNVEVATPVMEEAVQIMVVEEAPSSYQGSSGSFVPVKNIRYNDKYEIYDNINDQYDFYCEKFNKNRSSNLGIVDKNGNVILPHLFGKSYNYSGKNEVLLYINSNYGLFNVNELRWTVPLQYEEMKSLSNNLFAAQKGGKWGVIDNNNKVIVPFEWYQISSISNLENYIAVTSSTYPNRMNGIYSLIERKLTVPCVYSSLRKLEQQNYFLVCLNSKYNIVDINNVPLFKTWYDHLKAPSNGRNFYIVKNENRYGVIDESEKAVIPMEYLEFADYPFSDGSYLAKNKDGKYGFILIDGRITLPFEYDNLTKTYNNNIVSVQNGKCGLVQVNSGIPYEIVTCEYDNIKSGYRTFVVEKSGKAGLLDMYGKMLTPIEFQSIEALDENNEDEMIYKAKIDGVYKLLNRQGKPINEESYLDFSIIEKKNRSSYYYDRPKFTYIKAKTKNGKFCVVDKVGKTITGSIFEDILSESDNVFITKLNGKYGLYSLLDQKQIVDYTYDLIIKTNDSFYGIKGKDLDILTIKSGQVSKTSTR